MNRVDDTNKNLIHDLMYEWKDPQHSVITTNYFEMRWWCNDQGWEIFIDYLPPIGPHDSWRFRLSEYQMWFILRWS